MNAEWERNSKSIKFAVLLLQDTHSDQTFHHFSSLNARGHGAHTCSWASQNCWPSQTDLPRVLLRWTVFLLGSAFNLQPEVRECSMSVATITHKRSWVISLTDYTQKWCHSIDHLLRQRGFILPQGQKRYISQKLKEFSISSFFLKIIYSS